MPLGTPYLSEIVPTALGNQVSNVPAATAAAAMSVPYTPSDHGAVMVGRQVVPLHKSIPIALDANLSRALDPNDAPTVANALVDQTATQDVPFSYQFASDSFADSDNFDVLTYTAALVGGGALPAWLTFTASTRTFAGTPTSGDVGTVSIRVTATDLIGASVYDDFDIVVS